MMMDSSRAKEVILPYPYHVRFWHRTHISALPCPEHLNLALTNIITAEL